MSMDGRVVVPLLVFLVLSLALATGSATGTDPEITGRSPGKVIVEVYSESLCPDCSEFINRLSRFFVNGLIDIVDLRIIPFGNARLDISTGTFICQHGPDECKLNIIQTCAIKAFPLHYDWFPFIYCLENLPRRTAASIWKSSCGGTIQDVSLVEECYEGPVGLQLENEFAKLTDSLDPPHQYVPWVLVNGERIYESVELGVRVVFSSEGGIGGLSVCIGLNLASRLSRWTLYRTKV